MAGRRPFDVVLSSPRPRVLECARIVASRLGQPVVVVERLAGQEFGSADGRRWERVTEEFGGPPIHQPDRPVADGAEPWNVYADRVLAVLTEILADRAGQRVCVVGHGKTTGLAGALLSGAPDPRSAAAALVVSHGALAVWRQEGDAWHLVEDGGP
jgi:probable phosphoglycerate mutase